MSRSEQENPRFLRSVLIALGLGTATAVLAHPAIWAMLHWLHGMDAPRPVPVLLGAGHAGYWLIGLALAGGVGAWLGWGTWNRAFRLFAAVIALGCAALIATGLSSGIAVAAADAGRWIPYVILLGGAAAGSYAAVARANAAAPGSARARAGLLLVPMLCVGALAGPDVLRDARRPSCAPLRGQSLRLVAAYSPGPNTVVVSRSAKDVQWVEFAGQRFQLDLADRVELSAAEGVCARWYADRRGLEIATSGSTFWRVYRRSLHRMSQLDAIVIDGEVAAVPVYEALATNGLYLEWPESQAGVGRAMYEALTSARE